MTRTRIGDEITVRGTVRTIEALHPEGHLRYTLDVPPAAETPRTDERATLSEAPPKTWPENAYPTGAQYAAWLRLLTPEQQAEHLSGVIEQAERGAWCDVGSHSHRLAAAVARAEAAEAAADELAAAVTLLAHDAHPVYGSTAGHRGGIGGQAMTPGCSIIDPPPGVMWTQLDMPTQPARDWLRTRDVDLDAIKARLRDRWTAALAPATTEETR